MEDHTVILTITFKIFTDIITELENKVSTVETFNNRTLILEARTVKTIQNPLPTHFDTTTAYPASISFIHSIHPSRKSISRLQPQNDKNSDVSAH